MHSEADIRAEGLQKFQGLSSLVGNTPLLAIDFRFRGAVRTIYAKAENLNMTGSVKDRMALHILRSAWADGRLEPGGMIIEATSGNTGISFAAIGRALGHPVTIFIPDWMSTERIALIRSLGAKVQLVSRADGGFLGSIQMAQDLAARTPGSFLPSQFTNDDNTAAHERTTGPEIWWQVKALDLAPDAFVAGVGTGGTVMGVGRFFRAMGSHAKVHPLEPANSPTLSTGHKVGQHRIQGISDEFVPAIVELTELDTILSVMDGDAILMAQALAGRLGLGVGISSGANFLGAVLAQEALGPEAVVVTIFPDSNKKYLSTDLLRNEIPRPSYLSPEIELVSFGATGRVCRMCEDPVTDLDRATVTRVLTRMTR
jgi:cysteine synthase A